jgi:hypothetical protein
MKRLKEFWYAIRALIAVASMTSEDICAECPALGSQYCGESCEHFGSIKG